jgi:pyridoxal/pyridoxine/pyridoxamine kinase
MPLPRALFLTSHSTLSGYPTWRGQVLQADQMWQLYEGLCENNLTTYSHILTGAQKHLQPLSRGPIC